MIEMYSLGCNVIDLINFVIIKKAPLVALGVPFVDKTGYGYVFLKSFIFLYCFPSTVLELTFSH